MNAGLIAWTTRRYIRGNNRLLAVGLLLVNPGNSIIFKRIGTQMLQAQYGGDNGRHCKNEQQSTRELIFWLAHETPGRVVALIAIALIYLRVSSWLHAGHHSIL